jgi:hypothetical protein
MAVSAAIIGAGITGLIALAKELIPDKDKQSQFIAALEAMKSQVYMAELATTTIPWVDALHKMGRQIINVLMIGSIVLLKMYDIDLDPWEVMALGGGNAVYQYIKGKGK